MYKVLELHNPEFPRDPDRPPDPTRPGGRSLDVGALRPPGTRWRAIQTSSGISQTLGM